MGDIQEAFGGYEFDANQVEPQESSDPLPTGWYPVFCEEAEVRDTRAGTGKYLSLKYRVTEGEHANRVVFGNINLANPNQQAVEIGARELSALARAINTLQIADSADILNKPLMVRVTVKNDPEYGAKNEIKGYREIRSGAPLTPQQPPYTQHTQQARVAPPPVKAPVQASAAGIPPWKRKAQDDEVPF